VIAVAFAFGSREGQGRVAMKPSLGQGLRFGIAIAVLMTTPIHLNCNAVQPWPFPLVVNQFVHDGIGVPLD